MIADPISDEKLDKLVRETWSCKVVRGSSVWTSDSEIQLLGGALGRARAVRKRGMRQDQGGLRLSLTLPCNSTTGVVE
jgi:hypothetical protein